MLLLLYAAALVFFATLRAAQSSSGVRLTADPPWSDMFPGDTVTLTCQVTESEGWSFIWTRHRQGRVSQLGGSSGEGGSVYVLRSVKEKTSGMYQCEAKRGNNRMFSNFHNIKVWDGPPQAVVVTDPPGSVMFTGETVTLSCDIKGSGWRYSWARNTQGRLESLSSSSTETQKKHTLHSVTEADSGEYMCQGEGGQNPKIQSLPGVLQLNVSGEKQNPVITHDPPTEEMYTGERVTLSCGFGGDAAGWEYLWYKDTQGAALPNTDSSRTDGSSYTISSAALSHSGEYWCRAARGRGPFYSEYSNSVTLDISAPQQAELTVQSGWTEVFPTERVTLRCEIQGSSTEWMYRWYRDGQELPVDKADSSSGNGDTYTILSANQSHNKNYTCRGQLARTTSLYSNLSNIVQLRVEDDKPKPVITQDPLGAVVYIGENITLSCGFGGDPAGWEYLWYKDTQGAALPNTDSSRTDGSRYTISSAALSHSGDYCCGAARGRGPFYSNYSERLRLNISDYPLTVVTLEFGWRKIFTSGSVTLRCEVLGISAEWNYTWYRDGEIQQNHTRETLTVRIWNISDWGHYECQGNRSERPFHTRTGEGFDTNTFMLFCILGLSGSVLILITMVVLAVKCTKKCKKSGQSKEQLNKDEFYSRVNADYISAGSRLSTGAVYEEIDPATESQGIGQHCFYSAVQLKPLTQGRSM
ncbi:hypothetical protein AGOR_G00138770 [Albula goreensis]|uniref:Ig-like domain-containing protein n=1 Tax=Albula goreensis TaxID=1534307 RepID=A0A8T3D5Q2_9TELE|nr:hypothetical protein AGOR_G00138770 [Albula goreensis]